MLIFWFFNLNRRIFAKNSFHKVSTAAPACQTCANHSRKTHLAAKTPGFLVDEAELL
jgi:hypothetical protein